MEDAEDTARLQFRRRKSKRRSSILKPTTLPVALVELDPNKPNDEDLTVNTKKSRRSSKRVSFSATCQVKEFQKDGPLKRQLQPPPAPQTSVGVPEPETHGNSDSPSQPILSLNTLLKGPIQDDLPSPSDGVFYDSDKKNEKNNMGIYIPPKTMGSESAIGSIYSFKTTEDLQTVASTTLWGRDSPERTRIFGDDGDMEMTECLSKKIRINLNPAEQIIENPFGGTQGKNLTMLDRTQVFFSDAEMDLTACNTMTFNLGREGSKVDTSSALSRIMSSGAFSEPVLGFTENAEKVDTSSALSRIMSSGASQQKSVSPENTDKIDTSSALSRILSNKALPERISVSPENTEKVDTSGALSRIISSGAPLGQKPESSNNTEKVPASDALSRIMSRGTFSGQKSGNTEKNDTSGALTGECLSERKEITGSVTSSSIDSSRMSAGPCTEPIKLPSYIEGEFRRTSDSETIPASTDVLSKSLSCSQTVDSKRFLERLSTSTNVAHKTVHDGVSVNLGTASKVDSSSFLARLSGNDGKKAVKDNNAEIGEQTRIFSPKDATGSMDFTECLTANLSENQLIKVNKSVFETTRLFSEGGEDMEFTACLKGLTDSPANPEASNADMKMQSVLPPGASNDKPIGSGVKCTPDVSGGSAGKLDTQNALLRIMSGKENSVLAEDLPKDESRPVLEITSTSVNVHKSLSSASDSACDSPQDIISMGLTTGNQTRIFRGDEPTANLELTECVTSAFMQDTVGSSKSLNIANKSSFDKTQVFDSDGADMEFTTCLSTTQLQAFQAGKRSFGENTGSTGTAHGAMMLRKGPDNDNTTCANATLTESGRKPSTESSGSKLEVQNNMNRTYLPTDGDSMEMTACFTGFPTLTDTSREGTSKLPSLAPSVADSGPTSLEHGERTRLFSQGSDDMELTGQIKDTILSGHGREIQQKENNQIQGAKSVEGKTSRGLSIRSSVSDVEEPVQITPVTQSENTPVSHTDITHQIQGVKSVEGKTSRGLSIRSSVSDVQEPVQMVPVTKPENVRVGLTDITHQYKSEIVTESEPEIPKRVRSRFNSGSETESDCDLFCPDGGVPIKMVSIGAPRIIKDAYIYTQATFDPSVKFLGNLAPCVTTEKSGFETIMECSREVSNASQSLDGSKSSQSSSEIVKPNEAPENYSSINKINKTQIFNSDEDGMEMTGCVGGLLEKTSALSGMDKTHTTDTTVTGAMEFTACVGGILDRTRTALTKTKQESDSTADIVDGTACSDGITDQFTASRNRTRYGDCTEGMDFTCTGGILEQTKSNMNTTKVCVDQSSNGMDFTTCAGGILDETKAKLSKTVLGSEDDSNVMDLTKCAGGILDRTTAAINKTKLAGEGSTDGMDFTKCVGGIFDETMAKLSQAKLESEANSGAMDFTKCVGGILNQATATLSTTKLGGNCGTDGMNFTSAGGIIDQTKTNMNRTKIGVDGSSDGMDFTTCAGGILDETKAKLSKTVLESEDNSNVMDFTKCAGGILNQTTATMNKTELAGDGITDGMDFTTCAGGILEETKAKLSKTVLGSEDDPDVMDFTKCAGGILDRTTATINKTKLDGDGITEGMDLTTCAGGILDKTKVKMAHVYKEDSDTKDLPTSEEGNLNQTKEANKVKETDSSQVKINEEINAVVNETTLGTDGGRKDISKCVGGNLDQANISLKQVNFEARSASNANTNHDNNASTHQNISQDDGILDVGNDRSSLKEENINSHSMTLGLSVAQDKSEEKAYMSTSLHGQDQNGRGQTEHVAIKPTDKEGIVCGQSFDNRKGDTVSVKADQPNVDKAITEDMLTEKMKTSSSIDFPGKRKTGPTQSISLSDISTAKKARLDSRHESTSHNVEERNRTKSSTNSVWGDDVSMELVSAFDCSSFSKEEKLPISDHTAADSSHYSPIISVTDADAQGETTISDKNPTGKIPSQLQEENVKELSVEDKSLLKPVATGADSLKNSILKPIPSPIQGSLSLSSLSGIGLLPAGDVSLKTKLTHGLGSSHISLVDMSRLEDETRPQSINDYLHMLNPVFSSTYFGGGSRRSTLAPVRVEAPTCEAEIFQIRFVEAPMVELLESVMEGLEKEEERLKAGVLRLEDELMNDLPADFLEFPQATQEKRAILVKKYRNLYKACSNHSKSALKSRKLEFITSLIIKYQSQVQVAANMKSEILDKIDLAAEVTKLVDQVKGEVAEHHIKQQQNRERAEMAELSGLDQKIVNLAEALTAKEDELEEINRQRVLSQEKKLKLQSDLERQLMKLVPRGHHMSISKLQKLCSWCMETSRTDVCLVSFLFGTLSVEINYDANQEDTPMTDLKITSQLAENAADYARLSHQFVQESCDPDMYRHKHPLRENFNPLIIDMATSVTVAANIAEDVMTIKVGHQVSVDGLTVSVDFVSLALHSKFRLILSLDPKTYPMKGCHWDVVQIIGSISVGDLGTALGSITPGLSYLLRLVTEVDYYIQEKSGKVKHT